MRVAWCKSFSSACPSYCYDFGVVLVSVCLSERQADREKSRFEADFFFFPSCVSIISSRHAHTFHAL